MKRIVQAEEELETLLTRAETVTQTNPDAKKAERKVDEVLLEATTVCLKTTISIDMRLAMLMELNKHHKERQSELNAIARADGRTGAEMAAEVVNRAGRSLRGLKTLVAEPYKYLAEAEGFWNGEVRALAAATRWKSVDRLKLAPSEQVWKSYSTKVLAKLDSKLYLKANKISISAQNMSRIFGLVGAGLIITNVVIRTIADDRHWAKTFAKSGLTAGATVLASTFVTSAAVQSAVSWAGYIAAVMTNSATIAAVTAKVPPVAAIALATGVVIAIGVGVAALVDFLIDTWFGGPIPRSMRLSMQAPTTSSMKSQMSSSMFSSMS